MSDIWKVLGIEPTKDEKQIKVAYRTKLTITHPEDHPEAFKELRVAYEEAIKSIHSQVMSPAFIKSPIDLWMTNIEENYAIFSKRINLTCWKKLLEEEICTAFDTSDLARNRLLEFLSEHYYLPQSVWQAIDRTFLLQENEEELCNLFPPDFIKYVMRQINNESHIKWELFKGEDHLVYDSYIIKYFKLMETINEKNNEEYKQLLFELEDSGIDYIYTDVQKLRYALWQEDKEEAARLAELIIATGVKDSYIIYFLGEADWANENYVAAFEKWKATIEETPNHYYARIGLMKYDILNKACKEAKEKIYKLVDEFGSSLELEKYLKDINEKYTPQIEEQLKDDPGNEDNIIELGWCYLQQGEYEKCNALLEQYTPSDKYVADYYNLSGKNALASKDFDKALPKLVKWLETTLNLEDDGSEEVAGKKKRIPYAYYNIAMCYCNLGKDEDKNKDNYEKALEYVNRAIETIKERGKIRDYHSYKERKAYILLKLGKLEACVEQCDQIIAEDAHFYPAYLIRQEAFMELKDGKGVIEDYYHATNLFAGYIKPYLLAIKIFIIFKDYEEAKTVIERAESNELTSDLMQFYKLQIERRLEGGKDNPEHIIQQLMSLVAKQDKAKEEHTDIESFADIYTEISLCYIDLNEPEKAVEHITKAINLEPKNLNYRWLKADYYYQYGVYTEALKIYKAIESADKDNINIKYDLGNCYHKQRDDDNALAYYLEVVQQDPYFRGINDCLYEVYSEKFSYTGNWKYYNRALKYVNAQLETDPIAYYYINKGMLLTDGNHYKASIEAYEKAIEVSPDNKDAYNNIGYVYSLIGDFEKAEHFYKLSIEKAKDEIYRRPYINLAVCYLLQNRYSEAEKCYKKCIDLVPSEGYIYEQLVKLYMRKGDYEAAIETCLEMQKRKVGNKADIYSNIANSHWCLNKKIRAYLIYNNMFKIVGNDAACYMKKAEHYFYYQGDLKKALYLYECAINRKENLSVDEITECYYQLARCHGELKQLKMAKTYFDICLARITNQYESLEQYTRYTKYSKKHCGRLVSLYCSIGDLEKARIYLQQMQEAPMCQECEHQRCYEVLLKEAHLYELEGRLKEALTYYAAAITRNSELVLAKVRAEKIKKRLKGVRN